MEAHVKHHQARTQGGAEGARAPPFVSEGVLVKGANPRSFLERNLQFHTRMYCTVSACRSTIAPRRRAIVKLIFVESRVSRLTIPYTCTRFSVVSRPTGQADSASRARALLVLCKLPLLLFACIFRRMTALDFVHHRARINRIQ